jgi:hypothetical protein
MTVMTFLITSFGTVVTHMSGGQSMNSHKWKAYLDLESESGNQKRCIASASEF